jgi:hypothetical protein
MKRVYCVAVALAFAGSAHAGEVRDIPLEKCSAGQVLMVMHFDSLERSVKAGEASIVMWGKLTAIAARHPNAPADRPIGDSLTGPERDEFANVSAADCSLEPLSAG